MNRIRNAREALGWSQEELANRARLSTRTVHSVEAGLSCRQSTKRQILSALGVSFALRGEFFPGEGRPHRSYAAVRSALDEAC